LKDASAPETRTRRIGAEHENQEIATVLDRTDVGSTDRLMQLVRSLLAKRSIDRPVGRDDDLASSGLSSLDIVNLMFAVETEFDVTIPERDMTPANFRSIARIETLLRGLMIQD
jgi:acyl carrier protein